MSNFVSAIIVAAGSSVRMGSTESKQFIPLLGKPAVAYTIAAFQKCALINEIVIVCREQDTERLREIVRETGASKVRALVPGGASRGESVRNGIGAASENADYYAIHDGARPLVTAGEIERVTGAAFETGAATLGTPVTDTVKIVNEENMIESTPSRKWLRAVQTPQVFERDLYIFALEDSGDELSEVTDDCALIEKMGGEVMVVEGSRENIKLTTPIDVLIAESILSCRAEGEQTCG